MILFFKNNFDLDTIYLDYIKQLKKKHEQFYRIRSQKTKRLRSIFTLICKSRKQCNETNSVIQGTNVEENVSVKSELRQTNEQPLN